MIYQLLLHFLSLSEYIYFDIVSQDTENMALY